MDVPAVPATGEPAIAAQDLGKASANNLLAGQFYTNGTAWCVR